MRKFREFIPIVMFLLTVLTCGCTSDKSVWVCKPEKGLKIILNIDEGAQYATVRVRPNNFVSPTSRDYLFHDGQQFYISNDTLYRIGYHTEWDGTDITTIHTVYGVIKEDGFVITSKSDNSLSLSHFGFVPAYAYLITEYVFENK